MLVLLIGPPLLRLKGHYFAIATLGLNEAVKEIVSNTTRLTGGGMGMSLPLPPGGPIVSAVMPSTTVSRRDGARETWITWEFSRRRLGIACQAIRDNEDEGRGRRPAHHALQDHGLDDQRGDDRHSSAASMPTG